MSIWNSLKLRLVAPVAIVIVVVLSVVTAVVAHREADHERRGVDAEIQQETYALINVLDATRSLMLERVHCAMRLLRSRGEALGTARTGAPVSVGERRVNDLVLGDRAQANAFALVDGVVEVMEGTATLFVRNDMDFVRVSTNVKKPDGTRAVGTRLDPSGPVIAEIRQGKPFYGVVDILDSPYITGYEPIYDASRNNLIGVWYVGYKTELAPLDDAVRRSRILDTGFTAVLDKAGRIRFRSQSGPQTPDIERLLASPSEDWVLARQPVQGWDFELVSGYRKAELNARVLHDPIRIVAVGVGLCLLLLGLQVYLIWRRVLQPIGRLTQVAEEISLGRTHLALPEVQLKDEFGVLAQALARLANTVRLAMERLKR